MTAVFGDFARPVAEHITAAVSYPGELPGDARYGVIQQLARLTATFARYAADIPLPDEFTPAGRRQLNPGCGPRSMPGSRSAGPPRRCSTSRTCPSTPAPMTPAR